MKKVMMIQGPIPEYRVAVFNELAKHVDLTVVYCFGKEPKGAQFKCLYVPVRNFHWKFHTKNLYAMAQKCDVLICTEDASYAAARIMDRLPRKYKYIFWGIGVSAGYNARYDQDPQRDERRCKRINRADAAVFYASYPVEKYKKMGISEEKMFVANNTVLVKPIAPQEKENILFVGTLYKQKKIEELLQGYLAAYQKDPNVLDLVIIGDGEEREAVELWIKENELQEKIHLTGAIYDEDLLATYFAKAVACISPDQAGLSVLKSMGYGVPFVTHRNAITGGEIFNIKHEENGVLLDDFAQICDVVLDCTQNKEKYIAMGQKAKEHYDTNRTVPGMIQGFLDAIEYVTEK